MCLACKGPRTMGNGCQQDSDCGDPASAYRCEVQTGTCYCRTDEACPPSQYCNTAGFCQDRTGCATDSDCSDPGTFCDTTTGSCLPMGRCSFDLQCPLGQVCDTNKGSCVMGCRSNGDCPGSSCRCGNVPCNCTGQTPAQLQMCTIGVCDPNFCADDSFCQFGQLCGVPGDAGTTLLQDGGMPPDDGGQVIRNYCYSDFDADRRPYCANCSGGAGVQTCGTGANYCLIDTQNVGNFFCGADCSEGQSCPRGYECQDVIVVYTQWACSAANPACPANPALPCTADGGECRHGGQCVIASGQQVGFCAGQCSVAEGDPEGFCTCQVDADCAQETCSMGECSISRHRCVNDNDCKSIRCVDFGGVGGCLIGQNCAPANGLSCVQVGH
jgi:hypothetical protein